MTTIKASNDLEINSAGRLEFVVGVDAVIQRVIHHFRTRRGEWFKDLRQGSVIREEFLNKFGTLRAAANTITDEAEAIEGVDSVFVVDQRLDDERIFEIDLVVVVDEESRRITVSSAGAF